MAEHRGARRGGIAGQCWPLKVAATPSQIAVEWSLRTYPFFCLPPFQKTREGCGCPKFLAGKVFRQISTLLENSSPIFRQHEMLSLPWFGHFPARKTAAGKLAAPSGTLLDFLLRDRHSFLLLSPFCGTLVRSEGLSKTASRPSLGRRKNR